MTIRRIAKALVVLALVAAAHCLGQTPALVRTSPIVVEEPGLLPGYLAGFISTNLAASNGSDFLLAWGTNSIGGVAMGARISAAGQLMSPSGFMITASNSFGSYPKRFQVVASGEDYLFAYDGPKMLRSGYSTLSPTVSMVSKAGSMLFYPGIVLPVNFRPAHDSVLTAAANFSRSILIWMEDTPALGEPEITYAVLDRYGRSSRAFSLGASGYDLKLSAGSCGDGFLVGWSDSSGLKVARVDSSGQLLDPGGIVVSNSRGSAQVAGDGAEYLIAWNSGDTVVARRLSIEGEFVDDESATLMTGVTGYWRLFPKARGWEVVAKSGQNVVSGSVDPNARGLAIAQSQISVPEMSDRCAVARNNEGGIILSWNDTTNVYYRVWLPPSRLTETATIHNTAFQLAPLVVRAESGYALFWDDPSASVNPSPISTRFTKPAFPGAVPNEKSTRLVARLPQPAATASVGKSLCFVYPASSGIRGMTIPLDNAGAAPTPFQLAIGGVTDLSVTGHLTNFVLSWASGSSFVQRISPAAGVGPMISLPKSNMRIASDGKLLLAAYADSSGLLFASSFDEDTLAISQPVPLGSGSKPALAAKNGRALIVFENKPLYPSLLTAIRLEGTNWIGKTNIDLLSLRYTNNFTVAASDHGFLVFGKESRPFTAGNLPEPRTYAFYIDAASGSVVSNIVSNAGDIFGNFALAGGESDFLLAYSSAREGLKIVTQWIMPVDSGLAFQSFGREGPNMVGGFNSRVDRKYRIESSSDFAHWNPVGAVSGLGNLRFSSEIGPSPAFFRIVAKPE